jgi:hypothetical protein
VVQVSRVEEELLELVRSPSVSVKGIEAFVKANSKVLHSKHYINILGKFLSDSVVEPHI